MKKLILFLLVFQVFCVASFAQEKAKPTKQETMDWIAEKFKNYATNGGSSKTYDGHNRRDRADYYFHSWKYTFVKYEKNIITLKSSEKYDTTTYSDNDLEDGRDKTENFEAEVTFNLEKITNVIVQKGVTIP